VCDFFFFFWFSPFICRTEYHEYKFVVYPHMISALTNTPKDLSLHTLFHDTARVTQTVISSITMEKIDPRYYDEIVKVFKTKKELEPLWPLMTMEEMLHPINIVSRRGSISQMYRPSSREDTPNSPVPTNKFLQTVGEGSGSGGGSRPSSRASAAAVAAMAGAGAAPSMLAPPVKKEFEHFMNVLTMRKKQGGN
jgi:hypothetical protein